MSPTDNTKAVVLFTEPTGPAHLRPVNGRLLATEDGVLFFPFGAVRRCIEAEFDETLPEGPMSAQEEEWHFNNNARKFLAQAKTFTPQILFRGFNSHSGGGDCRLNGEHGVIPHAFLGGKALGNMWDTFELADMISDHLDEDSGIQSDFSSWTQIWVTARGFSGYPTDIEGCRVAVLDTALMEERIWHTSDLLLAGLTEKAYSDEFLAYGPVIGPNYHCVRPKELYDTTRVGDLTSLWKTPLIFGEDPGSCAIERDAVLSAMKVAAFLQPPSGRGETLAVLTARFVSYRAASVSQLDGRQVLSYVDLQRYLTYVGYQIQCLAMHAQDGEVILVDDSMVAVTRSLQFEVQLLQAVQRAVAIKTHQLRTTLWDVCRVRHLDELEQEDAVGQTEHDNERALAMVS